MAYASGRFRTAPLFTRNLPSNISKIQIWEPKWLNFITISGMGPKPHPTLSKILKIRHCMLSKYVFPNACPFRCQRLLRHGTFIFRIMSEIHAIFTCLHLIVTRLSFTFEIGLSGCDQSIRDAYSSWSISGYIRPFISPTCHSFLCLETDHCDIFAIFCKHREFYGAITVLVWRGCGTSRTRTYDLLVTERCICVTIRNVS
jgi:hypothetical protein